MPFSLVRIIENFVCDKKLVTIFSLNILVLVLNIILHDIDIFLSNLASPAANETLPDSAIFYP